MEQPFEALSSLPVGSWTLTACLLYQHTLRTMEGLLITVCKGMLQGSGLRVLAEALVTS